ncbi:unnamed protein product [Clonostachys rosea f. rosea IK726]|uniref:Uncharacterized protein n=1 Tax=Clonostachys rosea f. rosea IK726 TaxID=1349383 RepID=A0ACA9UNW8_BIOOC|nr:unnamed protein product [Clonostachys rosea f. rosea IK726]
MAFWGLRGSAASVLLRRVVVAIIIIIVYTADTDDRVSKIVQALVFGDDGSGSVHLVLTPANVGVGPGVNVGSQVLRGCYLIVGTDLTGSIRSVIVVVSVSGRFVVDLVLEAHSPQYLNIVAHDWDVAETVADIDILASVFNSATLFIVLRAVSIIYLLSFQLQTTETDGCNKSKDNKRDNTDNDADNRTLGQSALLVIIVIAIVVAIVVVSGNQRVSLVFHYARDSCGKGGWQRQDIDTNPPRKIHI